MKHRILYLLFAVLMQFVFAFQSVSQTAVFTYQGLLKNADGPVEGLFDLQFKLYDDLDAGQQVGSAIEIDDVSVVDGSLNLPLDFGAVFDGGDLFLEISVRPGSETGAFSVLSPRQPITSAPYAVKALEASAVPVGTITSEMLSDGAVTSPKIAAGAVNHLGTPDGAENAAVTVNNQGMVGIGTSNPIAGVHVVEGRPIVNLYPAQVFRDEVDGVTGLSGASEVALHENLVVVSAPNDSAVSIFDNSNVYLPSLLTTIRSGENGISSLNGAKGVDLEDDLLAVASVWSSAVTLFSITTPSAPTLISVMNDGEGGFSEIGWPHDVVLEGDLLAISSELDNAVTLVNVSDPASPQLHVTLKDGTFGFNELARPLTISLSGGVLAIGAQLDNAVTLVNISEPSNPLLLSVLKDGESGFDRIQGVVDVRIEGGMLFIASAVENAVTLVDLSSPALPALINVIEMEEFTDVLRGTAKPRSVSIEGSRLAVSFAPENILSSPSGAVLFDISQPLDPMLIGFASQNRFGVRSLDQARGLVLTDEELVLAAEDSRAATFFVLEETKASMSAEGRVGIGTTQPLADLHLMGSLYVELASDVEIVSPHFAVGSLNVASGSWSTAFGVQSEALGNYAVASGIRSQATGDASFATGDSSEAGGYGSFAAGGGTKATGSYATALGFETEASGLYSTATGYRSTAAGRESIAAGSESQANGYATLAAGRRAMANHDGTFVWADHQFADFSSTAEDQFLVRAKGGVGIGTSAPGNPLAVEGAGTDLGGATGFQEVVARVKRNGTSNTAFSIDSEPGEESILFLSEDGEARWAIRHDTDQSHELDIRYRKIAGGILEAVKVSTNGTFTTAGPVNPPSDRNLKQDFEPLDSMEILKRLVSVPIHSWSYTNSPSVRHVGPVAQDFHGAFGLGEDDKHIATVDADGVALAAIQGLNEKLERENRELRQRLRALERRLNSMVNEQNTGN